MATQATAVLTADLDSSKVLKRVQEITDSMRKIADTVLSPSLDVAKIKAQANDIRRYLEAKIGRVIPISLSKSKVAKIDTTPYKNAANEASKAFDSFFAQTQKQQEEIKRASAANFQVGKVSIPTTWADFSRDASAAARRARRAVSEEIDLIKNKVASLPDGIKPAFNALFAKAKEFLGSTGSTGASGRGGRFASIFKSMLGFSEADMAGASQKLKSMYENLASEIRAAKQKLFETSNVGTGTNILGIPAQITDTTFRTKIMDWIRTSLSGVKNAVAMGGLMVKEGVKSWSKAGALDSLNAMEFVKRFEWGQMGRAMVAEAEAAFSREALGRKIFSALFAYTPVSGTVGYALGKYIETLAGLVKSSSNKLFKAVESVATGIDKGLAKIANSGNALSRYFANLGRAIIAPIGAIATIARGSIGVALSTIQIIFNKNTMSAFLSISSAIQKGARYLVFKAVSSLTSAAKSIFSAIGKLFSFGGIGGGGGASSELSGGLTLGSILGLGGLATSLKLAANLEEKVAAIGTLTGGAGASFVREMSDITKLSNEFGKGAIDTASALYDIRSACFYGSEGLIVLRSSLTAAKGGLTSVATSSAAISRTLRAWNLPASEATMVADVMFNTVRRGITTFELLAQNMTQVTAVAAGSGASFQEVGAAMANLTRNGQTTDQAVTGLAAIFKSIISPTEQSIAAAQSLGIAWDEATLRSKGFVKMLAEAAPKILGNKIAFRELVGDVTALKSALILSSNTKGLQEDLSAMSERGAAAMASARIAITFNQQIEKFWNSFLNTLRSLGTAILPVVEPVFEKITEIMTYISNLANNSTNFVQVFVKSLGSLAAPLYSVIQEFAPIVLNKLAGAGNLIISALAGVIDAVSPLLIIGVTAIISNFWSNTLLLLKAGWEALVVTVKTYFKMILETVGMTWEEYVNDFKTALGPIGDVFTWIGKKFEWLVTLIKSGFQILRIKAKESSEFKDILKKTNDMFDPEKAIKEAPKRLKDTFNKFYDPKILKQDMKDSWDKTTTALSSLSEDVQKKLAGVNSVSEKNLKDQATGISLLIKELDSQYKDELGKGEKDKASITKQFIDNEKSRLTDILSQLQKSDLDEALKKRQEISINIAKAQRAQDINSQKLLINQYKENELVVKKLEDEAKAAAAKMQGIQNPQISLYDTLKNKALDFVKAGEKVSNGLTKLNDVLDDIFGKNIERIAEKYGVGKELVNMRNITRDVIEARAAGFSKGDMDKIIQRGFYSSSEAMTKIVQVFMSAKGQLGMDELQNRGVWTDIVAILDKAQALGMSEKERMSLLQNKLTKEAFAKADAAKVNDTQTKFMEQAINQFAQAGQERELQLRFNNAQLELGKLTKEAVTRNQKFEVAVKGLEDTVKQIKDLQKAGFAAQNAAGNP